MGKRKEIDVIEIYKTAFSYFKHHFKLYFSIFIIYMLLALVPNWARHLTGNIDEISKLRFELFALAISFVNLRVFMALIIAIRETIAEHDVTLKSAFQETKVNFWPYFRVYLILGLFMFIPAFAWAGMSGMDNLLFKIVMVVLGGISAVVLQTVYGFAPEIAVIFGQKKSLLAKSYYLIKGYIPEVFLINLPAFLILFISFGVGKYIKSIIFLEIMNIMYLLVIPVLEIASIIMVLKLYSIKTKK